MSGQPDPGLMRGAGRFDPMSRLPLALIVIALLILVIGGLVRISDAGESCPDWPTCFGKVHPFISTEEQLEWWQAHPEEADSRHADDAEHTYTTVQIFSEWLHRLLVGIVAVPVLWNWLHVRRRRQELGDDMVHIAFAGGVLLILQAIAGYVTVKLDNVDWSVALHLSLALCWISIFIWQWLLWLHRTTGLWPSARIAKADARAMLPLLVGSAVALLFLIILGAWVASTAGGAYNQSCSTGYSTGWPKCLGEWWPTFGTTGVLVQMAHRVGALLVGVVLIWASLRLREKNSEAEGDLKTARLPSRLLDAAAGFWLLNLFIGGLYIISAGAEGFIESLSLLHLMVGVSSFLVLMTAVLLCCVVIGEPLPLEQE